MKPVVKRTETELLVELENYGLLYDREEQTVMLTVESTPYAIFSKLNKSLKRELNSASFNLENYE